MPPVRVHDLSELQSTDSEKHIRNALIKRVHTIETQYNELYQRTTTYMAENAELHAEVRARRAHECPTIETPTNTNNYLREQLNLARNLINASEARIDQLTAQSEKKKRRILRLRSANLQMTNKLRRIQRISQQIEDTPSPTETIEISD